MPTFAVSQTIGAATPVWYGNPLAPTPFTLSNVSASANLYVGYDESVGPNNIPASTEVAPGGYLSYDGTKPVYYAVADAANAQVQILPGVTSFFLPTSLASLGGAKVFVQATAPTQPPTIPLNSLWFNTTLGAIENWNGSAWVVQSFNATEIIQAATITATQVANATLTTAQLAAAAGILGSQIASATITSGNIAANTIVAGNIAANTITASQLAAGIIYAGIVNGTEIDGAVFRAKNSSGATIMTINKTSATWILYQDTGSATQGMVIASATNSSATATDEFSNEILAGTVTYGGTSGAWIAVSFFGGNAIAYYTSTAATQTSFATTTSINFNSVGRASITDASSLVRNVTRSTSQTTGGTVGNTTVATALYQGVFHTSTDFGAGDKIEIKSEFNAQLGQTTAETFTIGYQLNGGTTVNLATIGAAIVATAGVYSGELVLNVRFITVGSSGTALFWLSGGVQAAANVLFTNGAAIQGTVLAAVAFNTTVVNTLQLVGQWGGAGGSDQTFSVKGATYTEY